MNKHDKFILTPITSVIEETITASSGFSGGLESYPLGDYILQSTFTKMTGFQEQKAKCIDWVLATNGYEYRISFIKDVNDKGTYSTYDAKRKVYNALVNEIIRYSGLRKKSYISDIKQQSNITPWEDVRLLFEGSNLVSCKQRDYNSFIKSSSVFLNQYYIVPGNDNETLALLGQDLKTYYERDLYRNRNRIAHNTLSYQQNLPDFKMLHNENDLSRNYFFWFSLLALIDEIYIELYKDYLNYLKDNSFFDE